MFAALTLEREPLGLSWDTFLNSLNSWSQTAGGFAMVGLVLWLIAYVVSRGSPAAGSSLVRLMAGSLFSVLLIILLGPVGALIVFAYLLRRKTMGADISPGTLNLAASEQRRGALTTVLFVGAFVWAFFGYLLVFALYLPELIHWAAGDTPEAFHAQDQPWRPKLQNVLWTVAGASAIFAVLVPIFADLTRLSLRRVWAIARLSFKEAVRRKVLWVLLALLLVVLFGSWFIPHKPEDQVRNYVTVVFKAIAIVILLLAALIASFGIPDDVRSQTIHTVITKPVQRFEIFLGRFLGYAVLLTAALAVVSGFALLYVLRNIDPEAQEESLKARERFRGKLTYQGTNKEKGENVGREWQYRGYISGKRRNSTDPDQYAIWSFPEVPAQLLNRAQVRLEFALDIYRTHKGVEGQGIFATFFVESWRFDADNPVMMQKYLARKKELEDQGEPKVAEKLAEEFGYFEFPSMEIKDFHTQSLLVPVGVFKNAKEPDKERQDELRRRPGYEELRRNQEWPAVPLRVRVRCDSPSQFLGMAPDDLFFRLDEDDASGTVNKLRFCLNFYKGSFGLWLWLCLILGLAVALSTYLSGVITLLTGGILFFLGFFEEHITDVALRKNVGGGPLESAMRLLKRPGGEPMAGELEQSATTQVATGFDQVFAWTLRRVMNLIPDVAIYNFTDFVAEGVAISGGQLVMAFLLLVGYVLPWAVLAYYLLKWREVASST
jgi:hypothetical protein